MTVPFFWNAGRSLVKDAGTVPADSSADAPFLTGSSSVSTTLAGPGTRGEPMVNQPTPPPPPPHRNTHLGVASPKLGQFLKQRHRS